MNATYPFRAVNSAVKELDLDSIKIKLMHVASGKGWSLEKVDAVEREYRRFLWLMKLYPHADLAPLADVDTFWHYHILDTMKYAVDCDQVFGYFLHHDPHVGLDGDAHDEASVRLDCGERMRNLYAATFGEACPHSCFMDAHATAYCAGPTHDKLNAHQNVDAGAIAYCAGPTHGRVLMHVAGLGRQAAARLAH